SKLKPGMSLVVRRPTTQTVLVTETGNRQVVKSREPVIIRASTKGAPLETVSTDGDSIAAVQAADKPVAKSKVSSPATRKPGPRKASK
ncbi:MAG: hypothetical protein H0T52_14340, partial [Lautropia sp.]|nr:hypothetical protein [Lautropia sp.]